MATAVGFFKRPAALAAVLWLVAAPARGQAPDEAWRTLTTEHFRVTFPAGLEPLGRRAADRAERAWARLEESFVDPPGGRVDLLVTDHTDISNGFAQVTPSNRITVFAAPPVDDPSLGYFDDWMELVVTHELAHVFHLDRTGALGRVLRGVFGRVPAPWPFFPGTGVPRWTIEGIATWYESYLTDAGRTHGTFQETQLRTAVLAGRFEGLGQASGDSPVWPAGARAYTYGAHFFEHLLDKHGEDRMAAFADAVAGQWVPYRLDAAGRAAFGASLTEEWRLWREELEARYADLDERLSRLGPVTRGERLTPGSRLDLHPKISPDGTRLAFARADGRSDAQLRVADLDGGNAHERSRANGIATLDWLPDGDLVVSQLELHGPYRSYGDLYRVGADGSEERLTNGERLVQPSASPDGRWVAAVQAGDGTNALVRVDLETERVEPLVPADADVHWAFPAVSPDGRWVAASRWTPGAYLDVVVLDLDGREVARLTRDRAVDLAPAWTPDGRWLLWGSDRSGIPNVLAASFDPASGRVGELRMATNVPTAVAYPEVDPGGRWLYVNAYHVDGWEIERFPLDPSSWPAAPPVAERFEAPPRPASVQDARAAGPVDGYNPIPTLVPRYWEPLYRAPVDTPPVRTDEVFVRSRRVMGAAVGAQTSGSDLVGRHAYSAFARVFPTDDWRTDWGVSWSWAGLGNPVLGVSYSQLWDDDGARLGQLIEGAPLDTLFVLERSRSLSLSTTFRRPTYRDALSLTLSGGLSWEDRQLLDNFLRPSGTYSLARPNTRLSDFRAVLQYSTARSYAFQTGAANGVSIMVRGRTRHDLTVPDSLVNNTGSDRSLDDVIAQLRAFKSLGGPGHAAHVLALRGAAGYAKGPGANAGHFEVGGAAGRSEGITGLDLFGGSPLFFPVRGYRESRRFGRIAWSVAGEYRVPLALVHRGLGAWPLYVDRITGALFVDAGNAWGPELGSTGYQNPKRSTLASAGAEVTTRLQTFWTEFLQVRTGAAVPMVDGEGVVFYLRLGLSF